jgi:glucose/arabinose dehydrogenase
MKTTYIFSLCIIFCFFISCSDESEIALSPIPDNSISLTNAFSNLSFNRPLDLQSPIDGTNRIFVAEQGGFIKVFENSETVSEATNFLDISSRTVSTSELGLLGFAFHPDYANNGFVFVTYTPREDLSVISRFKVSDTDANQIDVSSETILLQIEQPFTNHNGGQLAFGPDGYLYIASGDGGGSGDPEGNAQNLGTLQGKILRIDVDAQENGMNYAIPSDNPFVNEQGARLEIFAYGLRNPWRFSFDNQTSTIWAGDVGQGELEEINLIEKGANYGWNILEGTSCYSDQDCDSTGTIAPIFEYNHAANDKSITGGYVYRGNELPDLRGYYIYGDFVSGRIWALDPQGNNQLLLETGLSISSFGTDANNELYICSFDGKVNRLTLTN